LIGKSRDEAGHGASTRLDRDIWSFARGRNLAYQERMRVFLSPIFPFILLLLSFSASGLAITPVTPQGNQRIKSFSDAKKIAQKLHADQFRTIYCDCPVEGKVVLIRECGYRPQKDPKRATRLEWEHVVPAENFGRAFVEWREGSPECVSRGKKYKGRKCAEKNPEFRRMEADLYNLWPEIGELNGLRSNFSMAELGAEKEFAGGHEGRFGKCAVKIEDRKFEPMPAAKGRVARVHQYMNLVYPGRGIISDKNEKLFAAWSKLHPVDEWECARASKIKEIQGNSNPILESLCAKRGLTR